MGCIPCIALVLALCGTTTKDRAALVAARFCEGAAHVASTPGVTAPRILVTGESPAYPGLWVVTFTTGKVLVRKSDGTIGIMTQHEAEKE